MRTQEKPKTMARHNVPRRLDHVVQIKPFADIEPEETRTLNLPEHLLWLAVIDRAIADYVKPQPDLCIKYKQGLDWFFFEDEPQPFNLSYITEQLFDDSSAPQAIRKHLMNLKSNPEEMNRYHNKRYSLRINSKYF
jgi:hypothetical protein